MTRELESFLSQYVSLSSQEVGTIASKFQRKSIRKGDFLLKEGQVCKDFVFVETGCLRLFYESNETEISVWFAFANSSAIEIASFISGKPSEYSIQAIEDTSVLFLPKKNLEGLYVSHPQAQELMRRFWEDVILHLIRRFTALQKESAETRYINLMKNTDYLHKIPQKYLASFLGVTPTSLSRIRRKVK